MRRFYFLSFVHGQNGVFSEKLYKDIKTTYRKVAISIPSCLEAYSGFFRLLKKGIFCPYVLRQKRTLKLATSR